jgi:hypothetical protein
MKSRFGFFLTLTIFTVFLCQGCVPDESDPGTDLRDAYVGQWQFAESLKNTDGQSYTVTITKDPDFSSQVILSNFGNPGSDAVTAIGIVSSTKITLVLQQLSSSSWVVEGSGSFSDTKKTMMNWTYSITAGGSKDNFTAVATKQ